MSNKPYVLAVRNNSIYAVDFSDEFYEFNSLDEFLQFNIDECEDAEVVEKIKAKDYTVTETDYSIEVWVDVR